jgi:hypothetical protein
MSNKFASVDHEVDPQSLGGPGGTEPEDDLIRRATADRQAGRDTTDDVGELLSVVAKRNRAALDRLAK